MQRVGAGRDACDTYKLTLFPRWCTVVHQGLVRLQLAPQRPPGTDLKVGTESRRHEKVLTGRWCRELHVIHTN
jgi:hypothetical protein